MHEILLFNLCVKLARVSQYPWFVDLSNSLSTLAICIFYIALVFFLYKIVVIDNNKTFLIISEDHFLSNVILPT